MKKLPQIQSEAKRAILDRAFLNELKAKHAEMTKEINKHMIRLKGLGHIMGSDLRNKYHTTIHVPNKDHVHNNKLRQYSGVIDLMTLRLDHNITSSYIFKSRKETTKVANNKDHIDNEFAVLANLFKDSINVSRTLKQVELHTGEIQRSYGLAIQHTPNKIEYF